jgi:serine/threonine protein kinase
VELCRELGRGEFGVCFQGSWTLPRGDNVQVAVKRVLPEKLRSNPASFLQEAGVMVRMRHESVVRMYGVVLDTKSVMLVSFLEISEAF